MSSKIIPELSGVSYVEWGAIIAGSVLACAVSLVLLQFGNTLGLSVEHFQRDEHITSAKVITVGVWLLWVQLMASISGGYLAGRMRAPWTNAQHTHESELRDGTHGLLVWATSSITAVSAAAVVAFLSALVAQHGVIDNDVHISVDVSHRTNLILGFSLAATSLVSAVAAWRMGVLGGEHRDGAVDASRYVSFRKKRP